MSGLGRSRGGRARTSTATRLSKYLDPAHPGDANAGPAATALSDVEMTLVRAAGRTVFVDLRESVWQYLALTQAQADTRGQSETLAPCIAEDMLQRVTMLLGEHDKAKDVLSALKSEFCNAVMVQCKRWLTSLLGSVRGPRKSKHRRRVVLTMTGADYGNPDEILRDFCRNITTKGAVQLCWKSKLSAITVPQHGGDMRKETLVASRDRFFTKLRAFLPSLPLAVANAMLRLLTVNPATKALEHLKLLSTYMQLRFVIYLRDQRAHVILYGYVAKDLKGLQSRRSRKVLSMAQCTDRVMKVCSDNLFLHSGDSTPVVVILQHTSVRAIDEIVQADLDTMRKANEKAFFEMFDL